MKKLISITALIIFSLGIVSCENSQTNTSKETQINPTPSAKIEPTKETSITTLLPTDTSQKPTTKQPEIGTIKEMVNGDIMCYVTLVDEKGIEHNVGALFEICAEQATFLNKKVRAFYEIHSVNDCESAEPCGKSREESLIAKLEILSEKS
ncbi:hypothetical protein A6770_01490 [Nostoc minutum NIES-26]|uniref:Uncharacterized protein n=1 Tax=Nostoc minutum NIES-26 TaxID=1844469 RepID=A0A367QZK2_9NOSO|nr:hypothetical protein A6770_01490 [Nostoc minutum NIES-26]